MNALHPFLFEGEHIVRTVMVGEAPWFVAVDVCRILGIAKADRAVSGLQEVEKGTHTVSTLGGDQRLLTVSESGLYALIFRSRKPAAVRFRLWVTQEVLPAIRKTGSYSHVGEATVSAVLPEHREFPDWPLEEMRTKVQTVNMYQRLYGVLGAQWVTPLLGFLPPPPDLIERGRQYILVMNDPPPPEAG